MLKNGKAEPGFNYFRVCDTVFTRFPGAVPGYKPGEYGPCCRRIGVASDGGIVNGSPYCFVRN